MIRIAISLAAYQAITSAMPEGTARPPEPLEVGEGVGMWIDHATLAAPKSERRAGEGYSEVILRLAEARSPSVPGGDTVALDAPRVARGWTADLPWRTLQLGPEVRGTGGSRRPP